MLGSQLQKIGHLINTLTSDVLNTFLPNKSPENKQSSSSSNQVVHNYAAKGDHHNLKMLLSNPSINFDTPDEEGNTPLFLAMSSGSIETVNFFIERQCRLNFQNTHGQTPVFEALHTNNMEFIDSVLKIESLDRNICDENGQSILHVSVINGFINSSLALINMCPELANTQDKHGKTPLMYAAEGGYVNIIKILLNDKVEINLSCRDGWTAIMYATRAGALDIMSLLIAHGADLECLDHNFRQTPYLIACKAANSDAAELLLKHRARYDAIDYYNRTALHLAVETHKNDIVKLVLSTKVEVNAKDKFGLTAREWAVVNSTPEILKKILRAEKNRK